MRLYPVNLPYDTASTSRSINSVWASTAVACEKPHKQRRVRIANTSSRKVPSADTLQRWELEKSHNGTNETLLETVHDASVAGGGGDRVTGGGGDCVTV